MEPIGAVNTYVCAMCNHGTLTINLNSGVSHSTIPCPNCKKSLAGTMCFNMGKVVEITKCRNIVVTHVWYRPKPNAVPPEETLHVQKGGLILGLLKDREPKEPTAEWLDKYYGCAGSGAQ